MRIGMKEQNRESEPQRLGPGVEVSGASYGTGSNSVASAISPNKVLWGCWSLSGFHCPGTGSTKCSAGTLRRFRVRRRRSQPAGSAEFAIGGGDQGRGGWAGAASRASEEGNPCGRHMLQHVAHALGAAECQRCLDGFTAQRLRMRHNL